MIDCDYIIFHGERNTGRSSLLFALANICKSNNENIFFFGTTDEFNSNSFVLDSPFSRKFFYRHKDERLLDNIIELSEKENCEYIFIDDVDFLSVYDVKILNKSKVKKIATCLTGKIPKLSSYKSYELVSQYDDSNFTEEKYLYSDNIRIPITVFLKTFERDKKINSILK